MQIYNTLTRKKEEIVPIQPGHIGIYACGPTVYNYIHIGNARPICAFDVLRRYLKYRGYTVTYVQNFTDVDDKIIKKANEEGTTAAEIAKRYIAEYKTDAHGLNVMDADVHPTVTNCMDLIIDIVKKLVDSGHAYAADNGDVYFRTSSFPEYGKLSGQPIEELQAGARIDINDGKEEPLDFAVWKAAKPGEPYWDSPWGKGRPGWHIECSTMSTKYLGSSFDFHGGGSDLIFPHHENEIAQSEGATCCHPFVRYWVHNGFITINEEKMSKSLGNFFTVLDILKEYEPEVLRYFILQTHYRSPLDFSDARLKEASRSLERLRTAAQNLTELKGVISVGPDEDSLALREKVSGFVESFLEAMRDDFNTSLAISYLFALGKEINILHQSVMTGGQKPDGKLVDMMDKAWKEMTSIIGILEEDPGAKTEAVKDADEDAAAIESLIAERQEARKAKDFKKADAIRDELAQKGILLEDTPQGVRWKRQ